MPSHNSHRPSAWGQKTIEEFILPSGDTCLLKKVEPADLLMNGLQGVDILGNIVTEKIKKAMAPATGPGSPGPGMNQSDMKDLNKAIDGLTQRPSAIVSVIDQIVIAAVLEPTVKPIPENYADRRDEDIYIDSIPFDDKMAIFDWAMKGMRQIKGFRHPISDAVGALEPGDDVPLPPQ